PYRDATTAGRERIGAVDALVVDATPERGRAERLFFDAGTGLLLKRRTETPTPLGAYVVETIFSDYRDVGGAKVPYAITIAQFDGGTIRTFTDVTHNRAVDDAVFKM